MKNIQMIAIVSFCIFWSYGWEPYSEPELREENNVPVFSAEEMADHIEFEAGSSTLTEVAKSRLKALLTAANKKGDIYLVKVAVWSDKSFPADVTDSLPQRDINLAEERIANIEFFLTKELRVFSLLSYNMAEGINWFTKAFNLAEVELKSVFAKKRKSIYIDHELLLFRELGKARSAVVVVRHGPPEEIKTKETSKKRNRFEMEKAKL